MRKYYISVLAIIVLIASCTKKSSPTASKKSIDGAVVFSHYCARCHGPQGIKDARTPNLQTIALDKAGLVKSITYGKKGEKNSMPAFEDKLSPDEISAVADLIVSWHKK